MKLNMQKYRILTPMKYVFLFILLTLHSGLFGQERFFYLDLYENFLSKNDYLIKRISKDNPQKKFTYLTKIFTFNSVDESVSPSIFSFANSGLQNL